ncbi:MAG: 4-alpha-glucanotransferase [Deltaproteobacteria bacterium]|nr:4-alpha-glucanotransferase [Deltaproteobacteria bacterium]
MIKRGSGILLHISSLPSRFGVGDYGPGAYGFVDFLAESKQHYWQVLPLTPTDPLYGNSPYHGNSSFAMNPLFISPEMLTKKGSLNEEDFRDRPGFSRDHIDYEVAVPYKEKLNMIFCKRLGDSVTLDGYRDFMDRNAYWIHDYSLFMALKHYFNGKAWHEWPSDIRDRDPGSLKDARERFSEDILRVCLVQYVLLDQWSQLKNYCNEKGIMIIGDLPIYVVHDSADVWVNPELFNLDDEKTPLTVAGVPPDYFSETGQLWGNPVYRWDVLKERGFDWWIGRIKHNLRLYDFLRIDHFRGFVGYWEIPVREKKAVNGRWVEAPAWDFFNRMTEEIPGLPIFAEDLGYITPDVLEVIHHYKFPGMKILLFAFGDDLPINPYLPHNLERNCIIYTGTHDNNTAKGWFENEATPEIKKRIYRYLGMDLDSHDISRELVRLAMMSVADLSMIPMQDLLALDDSARMNTPGITRGNWEWRLDPDLLTPAVSRELGEMTWAYGRDLWS